MKRCCSKMQLVLIAIVLFCVAFAGQAEPGMVEIEKQFRELPMEARRLTGPLFWLHGDESKELLEMYVGKTAESGNGCFTAESRPHNDWLGEGWYRDLDICLQAAKKHDLKMWIFDERWWPSQGVGGKVPPEYAAKRLAAEGIDVEGPKQFEADGYSGGRYVGALAGRIAADGKIDGSTLVDLKDSIINGKLSWQVPSGKWKIMKFTHVQAPGLGQSYGGPQLSVDGASRDCVDWFIKTVYQPHYDRFGKDFGKTIPGYFYDEPETRGDWGTELNATLTEWGVDWKKAYTAYKFGLSGEEDVAARYQYIDALAETWGRTMYGGMSDWCRKHKVKSIGHFMEHGRLYFHREFCAGDMMRLQKYSDMGGLDLVCRQMYPGQRPHDIYQTPKLASSISHVFDKDDDLTMCEMFGAYGQDITYPQMKWLTDQMQVRGVNFMIPHSFNPRSPFDRDCPPYFYNGGYEPRYPLYRVYADYTSRLSILLSGGRHVCPVAVLFSGIPKQVGSMTMPEDITSAIQDALYDCDWLPFEVFEGKARIKGNEVALHEERYQVLVVPPAEVMPYGTIVKAREFFEKGGTVIGYGFLPSKSATIGKTSADITAQVKAIWGENAASGTTVCRKNDKGGRSYFLVEKPSSADITQVLAKDAGIPPVVEVLEGDTGGWLHVLHRVKSGRDVFLICNQNHEGNARKFRFRLTAEGMPECWDAMRNEIAGLKYRSVENGQVEFDLVLEPMESVLLVFQKKERDLPLRMNADTKSLREAVNVVRDVTSKELIIPRDPKAVIEAGKDSVLKGCKWVWFQEDNPATGRRFFRGGFSLTAGKKIKTAQFTGTCDNAFTLYVNGKKAGKSSDNPEGWRNIVKTDLSGLLVDGANVVAVSGVNMGDAPNPAGLIGKLKISFEDGTEQNVAVDGSWKAAAGEAAGWEGVAFDDSAWSAVKVLGEYGCEPWYAFADGGRGGAMTLSTVTSDPFAGHFDLPGEIDPVKTRVCIEADVIAPEEAACITVNGRYAGGFIGKPFRLDVTEYVKSGRNSVVIEPFAPQNVKVQIYGR